MFDVDIDFPTNFKPEKIFPLWPRASILKDEKLVPHPCGVYPQAIARDPITKLAAIPYDEANEVGYFKLDFLHLNVYNHFESREEILALLDIEPNWELFKLPSAVLKLFQLAKHYDLLQQIKPSSVEEIADVLALIRPGKSTLLGLYLKDKVVARKMLYLSSEDFSFKRSHAISYALVVVLQLHLIEEGLI